MMEAMYEVPSGRKKSFEVTLEYAKQQLARTQQLQQKSA